MCCILCEEPVRSITLGLAALGIVSLIQGARKMIQTARSRSSTQRVCEPRDLSPQIAGDAAP